jgi:hypothetical protein
MDSKKLIDKITDALLEIEKSEGVKIDFKFLVNYTGMSFDGSIKDSDSIEKENALNLSVCRRIGFTQNIIGACFDSPSSGGKFRITSIQPKNRKYPVIAINLENQKSYKFTTISIKKALGGDQSINRFYNLEKLTQNDE